VAAVLPPILLKGKRKNGMARRIVVTSGKGGVGKTTLTANLGAALAKRGFRVALMDADIGLNNLDVVMGIENKVVYDIVDVIEGRCRPKQAMIQDDGYSTLYIMPSSHSYDKSVVTGQSVKLLAERLSQSFDYILLDCPAGIELGFHRAVSAADEAVVVTTPHISSIRDADKVLNILGTYDLVNVNVVVNRVRGDLVLSGDMLSPADIAELLKRKLSGVIPESDTIAANAALGRTFFGGEVTEAFSLLAGNIHTGNHRLYDCARKYRGVFGALKRGIKKRI
jgi:septum site-determining protein MinD